jgi:DnaJ-class molecular chaperone
MNHKVCLNCNGEGYVDDPSACDTEYCQYVTCHKCHGRGVLDNKPSAAKRIRTVRDITEYDRFTADY